jgi:acetamidase/formamidase
MDPPVLRVQLSAQSLPLAVLRVWLARQLQSGAYRELTDAAQLVLTELVTNVYQHAPGPAEVTVCEGEDWLRIAVSDVCHTPPRGHRYGLGLVAALAHRWGVEVHDEGKTVWAELRLRPAPAC